MYVARRRAGKALKRPGEAWYHSSMPRLAVLAALPLALSLCSRGAAAPRLERAESTLVYPDFWHTPLGIHRGTPELLELLLGGRARFDDPEGVACVHMAEDGLDTPQITAFGVNRGASQLLYNPDLRSLEIFGRPGSGKDAFDHPTGVACLADGSVAVADTGNDRIVLLDYHRGELAWKAAFGGPGAEPGSFSSPEGVALDSSGKIYVADTGNNRIQVFTRDGRLVRFFGGDRGANNAVVRPRALAVVDPEEPYAVEPEGALFVVDLDGRRIQKFGLDGSFQGQALAADVGRPAVDFAALALDYFDNVWVTDRANGQIHKFDAHLRWVASWGRPGQGDGTLDDPRGIAIYRRFGQVLVLERESAQYLWIGADVKELRFSRTDWTPGLRIDWRLTERAWVDAWIEDADGKRVATLLKHRFLLQGDQTLRWNGSLDAGSPAEAGRYELVLQSEAGYSSAAYVKREIRRRFLIPRGPGLSLFPSSVRSSAEGVR